MESDMDEDFQAAYSPSPPPIAHSPRSEVSPSPSNWTSTHEQAAQEAYECELAEQYLYDLVRHFASATRALSLYDSPKCLAELEKLPYVHQTTPWVLAMIGRAHYEQLEYSNVGVFLCSSTNSSDISPFPAG
jgi:anaphase-promoting complex subunit 3